MNKILSYKQISRLRNAWDISLQVVLVTGVFDLLHHAHRQFLKKAKDAGDILLVGVETDERVKQLKGWQRPYEPLALRLLNLSKLRVVDFVFSLPKDFNSVKAYLDLLQTLKPNILAVSSHTPFLKEKKALLKKVNGKVKIVLQQNIKVSTTIIGQERYKKAA